jgi:hypothetical protein
MIRRHLHAHDMLTLGFVRSKAPWYLLWTLENRQPVVDRASRTGRADRGRFCSARVYFAGMVCGSCPSLRELRATNWALGRHRRIQSWSMGLLRLRA